MIYFTGSFSEGVNASKRIPAFFLAVLIFMCTAPCCNADESKSYANILEALEDSEFSRTGDGAWDSYISLLFDYDDVNPENLAFGYYNMETGEEYYHNGDEYFIAASLYKVPLNMVYSDVQSEYYTAPDEDIWGAPYSYYRESTLIYSQNDTAEVLWNYLGGYMPYKQISSKYLTDDPDSLPWTYYENNYFTAKQFIYCLKLLCGEPERFPGIIDCMLEAAPDTHFRRDVMWCPIASKTGYVTEEGYHTVANDMAIVYTTETFAIVMMTDNIPNFGDVLADYCTLMCDYTNTRKYARDDEKAAEEARIAEQKAAAEKAAAAEAAQSPQPAEVDSTVNTSAESGFRIAVISVIILIAAGIAVILFISGKRKHRYISRH